MGRIKSSTGSRQFLRHLCRMVLVLSGTCATAPQALLAREDGSSLLPLASRILAVADQLLEEAQVSYVYGGSKLGDGAACHQCNTCLEKKSPRPSLRLRVCPRCADCSLDCSHFTELVFNKAGAPYPYLPTASMLELSTEALRQRYQLLDLGANAYSAGPGDLLVYDGHVVILERLHPALKKNDGLRGDVIHATGGRDIKLPGQGIQRERFVEIAHLRGPLRRILRHEALAAISPFAPLMPELQAVEPPKVDVSEPRSAPVVIKKPPRLRPVLKQNPNED